MGNCVSDSFKINESKYDKIANNASKVIFNDIKHQVFVNFDLSDHITNKFALFSLENFHDIFECIRIFDVLNFSKKICVKYTRTLYGLKFLDEDDLFKILSILSSLRICQESYRILTQLIKCIIFQKHNDQKTGYPILISGDNLWIFIGIEYDKNNNSLNMFICKFIQL